jgi:hypothetical protein
MIAMAEPLVRHIRHAAGVLLAAISSLTMPWLAKSQAAAGDLATAAIHNCGCGPVANRVAA